LEHERSVGVGLRAKRRRRENGERSGREEGWNGTNENGKRSLRGTGGNGTWEYRRVDPARITKHLWTAWTVHAAASRCEIAFVAMIRPPAPRR
jgi:hypothetical protein